MEEMTQSKEKEELEDTLIKMFKKAHEWLEDLEDIMIVYGRCDEPSLTEEEYKKWFEKEEEK